MEMIIHDINASKSFQEPSTGAPTTSNSLVEASNLGVILKPSTVVNLADPNLYVGDGVFPIGFPHRRERLTYYIGKLVERVDCELQNLDPTYMVGFQGGHGCLLDGKLDEPIPRAILAQIQPLGYFGHKCNGIYPGSTLQQTAAFDFSQREVWDPQRSIWRRINSDSFPIHGGLWARFPIYATDGKILTLLKSLF